MGYPKSSVNNSDNWWNIALFRCGFEVCDEICENGHWHQIECQALSMAFKNEKNQISKFQQNPSSIYSCITPLRFLLRIMKSKQDRASLMQLVGHEKERKKDPNNSMTYLMTIATLQKVMDRISNFRESLGHNR